MADSLELVKLYNSLDGPNWTNKTNWLVPGKSIDTWYGIKLN
ncbi:MAG: Two component regulator three Y domain protein, partial [Saprospiraceae bacterium]|nr:Two component regulator three Y domain protein [Saprospiraceae bacterium]